MMLGLAVTAGDDAGHIPGTELAGVPAEMLKWFGGMMPTPGIQAAEGAGQNWGCNCEWEIGKPVIQPTGGKVGPPT